MNDARLKELEAELARLLVEQNNSTRDLASLRLELKDRAKRITAVSDELDELYVARIRSQYDSPATR